MSTTVKVLGVALINLGLSLGLVAQESAPEEERIPPPVAGITAEDNTPLAEEARPDTHPVTGLLRLTFGSFDTERSFVAPSFQFSQTADSNPFLVSGQSETVAVTNLSANARVQQIWRQSQFSLNYIGGGSIYAGQSDLNSMFQAAQIQQSFQFRRWSLTLADDVTYTPESVFGYPGLSGGGTSNLVPGTAPNQTILTKTNQSQQIGNTAVGQLNYKLNGRSSLTISGNFAILRFPGSDLLDSDQERIQVGYNHDLNPRDSLGISYGLNLIRYPGTATPQNLDSHNIQFAYGRKITGRLALQASGGPQINQLDEPILGSVTLVTWTARSSLIYRFRKSEMQLGYSHDVGGGAGILGVTKTDQVEGTVTARLTRTLTGSFTGGYAHNTNLQEFVGPLNSVFNTEFVSARLDRPLGHEATTFFNYTFQHQSSNVLACGLGLCGTDLSRHMGSVGFAWHMRPLLIH
jgi:hypothetical protein